VTLRILHVYKDYDPVVGGIENHIRVLAEAQAAAGMDVGVLVCNPGGLPSVERRNGVEVLRAQRLATALSMPISAHQPVLLARHRADVVHVHAPYPLGEVSALALRHGARLVLTYHADIQRQQRALRLYAPFLRRVLRAADRIIATSPNYIKTSPWLAGVADRCRVVPLGVDQERFSPGPREVREDAELLFVGRLRYYKGLDVLLRALRGLRGIRLRIVGDGPMGKAWRSLAQELGLQGRVSFEGRIPDEELPEVYRRARVFILPSTSRAEAFGTVLLEAMASGLPCITTELGTGTSWVVRHEQTGLVVPAADQDALRDAIARLIADPARAAAMGAAGRQRIESCFTVEAMVAGVTAIYAELLSGDRSPPAGVVQS